MKTCEACFVFCIDRPRVWSCASLHTWVVSPATSYWACKLWSCWKWGGHLCRAQTVMGTFHLSACWEQSQSPSVTLLFANSPEKGKLEKMSKKNTARIMHFISVIWYRWRWGFCLVTGYSWRSTGSLKGSESSHWKMRSSSSLQRPLHAWGSYEWGRFRSWRCMGWRPYAKASTETSVSMLCKCRIRGQQSSF